MNQVLFLWTLRSAQRIWRRTMDTWQRLVYHFLFSLSLSCSELLQITQLHIYLSEFFFILPYLRFGKHHGLLTPSPYGPTFIASFFFLEKSCTKNTKSQNSNWITHSGYRRTPHFACQGPGWGYDWGTATKTTRNRGQGWLLQTRWTYLSGGFNLFEEYFDILLVEVDDFPYVGVNI